jgi:hypothetical protein
MKNIAREWTDFQTRLLAAPDGVSWRAMANHVIGHRDPSRFHSFVAIAPTLCGNSTSLWIRLSSLSPNLVSVDSMHLDLRHSNSAAVDEIKAYRGL